MTRSVCNFDGNNSDMALAVMNLMAIERCGGEGSLVEMVRQIRAELLESESRRAEVEAMAQELLAISDALNCGKCTFGVDSNN